MTLEPHRWDTCTLRQAQRPGPLIQRVMQPVALVGEEQVRDSCSPKTCSVDRAVLALSREQERGVLLRLTKAKPGGCAFASTSVCGSAAVLSLCLPGFFVGVGGDVGLDHPLDVFVFGWPGEGGDRVAERDAAVESGPEVRGLGEGVCVVGETAGDDRDEVV